jgi:CRP-like cAMP-binding protein
MLADDRHVGNVERLFHLRKAPVIGTLHRDDLALVAEAARPRTFRKGEKLLRENERPQASYILMEGRVHVEASGRVLGHAGPGSALGGVAIIARAPSGVSATAETDVLALELDADALLDLLEDHFNVLCHLLRAFAGQIIEGWRHLPEASPVLGVPPPPATSGRDLDLVERILHLRQTEPFDRANVNALAELARGLSEQHFEGGVRLWSEGEEAHQVLMILHGQVACSASTGFHMSAGAGTPIGAMEGLAGRPRWYDAVTVGPVVALCADVEILLDVFEENIEMGLDFLSMLGQRLIQVAAALAAHDPRHLVTMGVIGIADPEPAEEVEAS